MLTETYCRASSRFIVEAEGANVREMDGLPRGCCEASNTDAALGNCVGSTEGINDGSAGGIVLGYGMGELLGMSDGLVVVGRSDRNAMGGLVR